MQKNIIYEDEAILAVFKPAGIATQTARLGQQDMVSELKNYLVKKPEYRGKNQPYIGVVHRLDQPVSGILVFAKTKQAAAELGRQITSGKMHKYYYAVVYGRPDVQKERLENFLYKNAKTNLSLIVEEGIPNAKKAVLEYKLVKSLIALEENAEPEEISLIEIKLITGRHHQIRAQMSHAGMPLIGDNKYGNDKSKNLSYEIKCRNVSLCAYKLEFFHPVSMKKITFEKQPEEDVFTPFFTRNL